MGSILAAVLIVQLVYYGILLIRTIHNRRHPPADYYGTAGLVLGQCGPGGCPSPQSSSSGDAWQLPTNSGEPWIYKINGREVGRINGDGSRVGFASEPTWYPSGMPASFQHKTEQPSSDKPTGVNVEELAKEKANATTGITVNGQPVTEGTLRDKLSDSARARGLRDYSDTFRIVIVGDDAARKEMVRIAEPFVRESNGKAIIQEYPSGAWQVSAHTDAVKKVPEYQHGQPFAYVQTDTPRVVNGVRTNVMGLAVTSMELGRVLKDLRPEVAPDFDPNKARVIQSSSKEWLAVGFVFACIAVVFLGSILGGGNKDVQ